MLATIHFLDLLVLTVCILMLLKSGRISYSHPATIYLLFHFMTFTLRIIMLLNGAPPMFSDDLSLRLGWSPITEDEIVRAALIADASLFAMTLAWIKASDDDIRRSSGTVKKETNTRGNLELNRIWPAVVFSFSVGLIGVYLSSNIPGFDGERANLGDWKSSTWVGMLQTWPGIAILMLIYWYGFRRPLVLLLALYLLLMAYQGYSRNRVIIPLILLSQIYLDRRLLRWPPLKIIVILMVGALLFFPLKSIGRLFQQGASLSEVVDNTVRELGGLSSNSLSDLVFMDQFAASLTLSDRSEKMYLGMTYLPVLTLAIPRPWWPDKPSIASYLSEIQTNDRPLATLGMIVTLLGESYVNFGHIGVIVVPCILGYWLARFYFVAYRENYFTTTHFFYLITASSLLQVYRDGLPSLILFTCVQFMPLIVVVLLHRLFPPRSIESYLAQSSTKKEALDI